jgi:hypothetical protein
LFAIHPFAVFDKEESPTELQQLLVIMRSLRDVGIAAGMPDKVEYASLTTQ